MNAESAKVSPNDSLKAVLFRKAPMIREDSMCCLSLSVLTISIPYRFATCFVGWRRVSVVLYINKKSEKPRSHENDIPG